MTDLFSYHVTQQHLADQRKTLAHTQLVPANDHHASAHARRLITGMVSRISAPLHRRGQAIRRTPQRTGSA